MCLCSATFLFGFSLDLLFSVAGRFSLALVCHERGENLPKAIPFWTEHKDSWKHLAVALHGQVNRKPAAIPLLLFEFSRLECVCLLWLDVEMGCSTSARRVGSVESFVRPTGPSKAFRFPLYDTLLNGWITKIYSNSLYSIPKRWPLFLRPPLCMSFIVRFGEYWNEIKRILQNVHTEPGEPRIRSVSSGYLQAVRSLCRLFEALCPRNTTNSQ